MTDEQERERAELLTSRLSVAGQEINGLKKENARLEGALKDTRAIVSSAIDAMGNLRFALMPDGQTLADAVRALVSRAHWATQLDDIRARGWTVTAHYDLPGTLVLWTFRKPDGSSLVATGIDDAEAIARAYAKVIA